VGELNCHVNTKCQEERKEKSEERKDNIIIHFTSGKEFVTSFFLIGLSHFSSLTEKWFRTHNPDKSPFGF